MKVAGRDCIPTSGRHLIQEGDVAGQLRSKMVTVSTGKPVKNRSCWVVGSLRPQIRYGIHNPSHVNVERALVERVYLIEGGDGLIPPPKPAPGEFRRLLLREWHQMSGNPTIVRRLTQEEFWLQCPPEKRRIYREAVDSLKVRPLERKDAYLKSFVKREKVNFTAKRDPAPRVIQPRSPRFNVEVGCFLRPLEKLIYHRIDRMFGGPVVMKGKNAEQRGRIIDKKWSRFKRPVALGVDAKRFDQHVSKEALEWEHSIYKTYFAGKDRKELATWLKWQIYNKGLAVADDAVTWYEKTGSRMSGDMNTSLGNVLLMCCMMHAFLVGRDYEFVNDGDDCVIIMEYDDALEVEPLIVPWFLQVGFSMKVEEPVDTLEEVVFCQSQPVWDGAGYLMVRQVPNCVAKDATCLKTYNPVFAKKWLTAVGEGGLAGWGGIPIVQEVYKKYAAFDKHGLSEVLMKQDAMYWHARGVKREYHEPSARTRFSFWLAFGIAPEQQIAIERQLGAAAITFDMQPATLQEESSTFGWTW